MQPPTKSKNRRTGRSLFLGTYRIVRPWPLSVARGREPRVATSVQRSKLDHVVDKVDKGLAHFILEVNTFLLETLGSKNCSISVSTTSM